MPTSACLSPPSLPSACLLLPAQGHGHGPVPTASPPPHQPHGLTAPRFSANVTPSLRPCVSLGPASEPPPHLRASEGSFSGCPAPTEASAAATDPGPPAPEGPRCLATGSRPACVRVRTPVNPLTGGGRRPPLAPPEGNPLRSDPSTTAPQPPDVSSPGARQTHRRFMGGADPAPVSHFGSTGPAWAASSVEEGEHAGPRAGGP